MILIDYSQIAIANIVIALKRDGEIPTPEMARYMILNSIRGYVHQYKEEYGPDFCGKKAIHIGSKEIDIWFICHSNQVTGGTYKCVYNE